MGSEWHCKRLGERKICWTQQLYNQEKNSSFWALEHDCLHHYMGTWCRHGLTKASLCYPKQFLGADRELAQISNRHFPCGHPDLDKRLQQHGSKSSGTASLHVKGQFLAVSFTSTAVTSVPSLGCPSNEYALSF